MTKAVRAAKAQAPIVEMIPRTPSRSGGRPSQRIVCLVLILTLLSFAPVSAQQEGSAAEERASAIWAKLSRTGDGVPGTLTREARLRQTVRLLWTASSQPTELPGFDLPRQPADGSGSSGALAQGGNAALEDSQGGGLPWWAWALIGAGVATAAMQLDFGDKEGESEDD